MSDVNKSAEDGSPFSSKVIKSVFIILLLDLLGFTLILPLLPSILDHYAQTGDVVYQSLQSVVDWFREAVGIPMEKKYNTVLFGGLIGSLFSLLQFLASPVTGALSDRHGRRPLLILTTLGLMSSYAVWAVSRSFSMFLLFRVIGGICKGNVSLCTAIVADLTCPKARNRGMAMIGIAFSLGFTVGPLMGAYFALSPKTPDNVFYETPALLALAFSAADLMFIWLVLPETLTKKPVSKGSSINNPHKFSIHSYKVPTFCDHCSSLLWGFCRQGETCKTCKMNIHVCCRGNVAPDCVDPAKKHAEPVSKGSSINNPHKFSIHDYKVPTFCDHCGSMLWGVSRQGETCKTCKMNVHISCKGNIPPDCGINSVELAHKLAEPVSKGSSMNNPHKFHIHDYKIPTFCDHCGSMLWGFRRQGETCKTCKMNVHIRCRRNVAPDCGTRDSTSGFGDSRDLLNPLSLFHFSAVTRTKDPPSKDRMKKLQVLGLVYFFYLFLFSGLEFTLSFLTHQRFHFTSMQQGKMFFFIGVIMALIQGGYARRIKPGHHIRAVYVAILALIPAFILIGLAWDTTILYIGLALYSFAAALVVPCLSTLVSDHGSANQKGTVMGILRSLGALARALGPVVSSSVYWIAGAQTCFLLTSASFIIPLALLRKAGRLKEE